MPYADSRKTTFKFVEESFDTYEGEPLKRELLDYNDYRDFRSENAYYCEVLAPASVGTYKQAVYGGADAIYFGYGEFNARAGGDNFLSIKEVVDFCHFYNVKAYLALNICFKNSELSRVKEVILEAEAANIDAFIICDLTLVPMIRKYSNAPVHASTQLGAHNAWGIGFLRDMAFNRAVLSREVKFEDVRHVTDSESLETEVFVHGALCSCFSGGCLLSGMLTGNSANRGKCNQLCRKYYKAFINGKQADKGYLLSAKDICLDKHIDDLVDIGVSSLKIEGRLKRAEYVGGMTMYYKDVKFGEEPIFSKDDVKVLFNRGNFTQGYFEDKNVIYTGRPNHIGIYVGRVVHLLNGNMAYVASDEPLQEKNGYRILRNLTEIGGAVATGEYKNGFSVIKSNEPLKVGDKIRLTNDYELSNFVINRKKHKNVPMQIRIVGGQRPEVSLNIKGHKYKFFFEEYADFAINQPLTEEEIRTLFESNRVREIKFIVTDVQLYNAFMTKAQLNRLRRKAIDDTWRFLLGYYQRSIKLFKEKDLPKYGEKTARFIDGDYCEVDTLDKAHTAAKRINNIVYNPSVYDFEECKRFYNEIKNEKNNVFIKLPIYVPTGKEEFFERIVPIFDGILANNIGAAFLAKKHEKLLLSGQNLNITNTKNWLIKNSCSYIVSTELNYSEIKKFDNPLIYAYGYLPLMHLNCCPRKSAGLDCGECDCDLKYTDEKGEYPITTQKFDGYCEHVLRNGVLTDVGNCYPGVRNYFDFTMSSCREIKEVFSNYYDKGEYKPVGTNKLHLKRGVE